VVAIELAASMPETPLVRPHGGVRALGILRAAAANLGFPSSSDAVMTLSMLVLFVAAASFLVVAREAWMGRISVKWALVVGIVLHLLVLPAPILFTNDVYVYMMYGRIVSEHQDNPYTVVPADFPDDPFLASIRRGDEGFGDETSVYGPVFTTLSAAVTATTSSIESAVWAFRVIAMLSSLATMLLAMMACRKIHPQRAAFAAVMVGWNPLVILHAVGGEHNDTLVGLSLAAGVFLALSSRFRAATFCLALGALVKIVVAGPLFVLVAGVMALAPRGLRLRTLFTHIGVAAVATLPFVIPFLQRENPTLGALPASERFLKGSGAVRDILEAVGLDSLAEPLAKLAQGIAPIVILIATILVAFHLLQREVKADRETIAVCMGWVMLVTFLYADNHLSWYGMWIVPFAWILPRAPRSAVLLISLALTPVHPWAFVGGRQQLLIMASAALIYLILLRVSVEFGIRLVNRSSPVGVSAFMDEESAHLPKVLAPLRWLDLVAPPSSVASRSA
jgi:hypothetical protein